jgi:hypothetical protein
MGCRTNPTSPRRTSDGGGGSIRLLSLSRALQKL